MKKVILILAVAFALSGCAEPKKYGSEAGKYTLTNAGNETSVLLNTETGEIRVLEVFGPAVISWGSLTIELLDSLSKLDDPVIDFRDKQK